MRNDKIEKISTIKMAILQMMLVYVAQNNSGGLTWFRALGQGSLSALPQPGGECTPSCLGIDLGRG